MSKSHFLLAVAVTHWADINSARVSFGGHVFSSVDPLEGSNSITIHLGHLASILTLKIKQLYLKWWSLESIEQLTIAAASTTGREERI